MGFDNFIHKSNYIQFKSKIKYPSDDKISQYVIIPINISYVNVTETDLRYLNYTKNNNCIDSYCTYLCSVLIDNTNITKVKFNDKAENYKYTLSSLANITKDISSKKDSDIKNRKNLKRNDISFLEHAIISSKSGRHFEIKGDFGSNYESDNIKLIVSKNSYSRELPCKGYKDSFYTNNYNLDCDISTSSINADLQNTFAYLEDKDDDNRGFIINFDKFDNSTVTNSTIETNDYIPKKS